MKHIRLLLMLLAAAPMARADDHDKFCAELAQAEKNFCAQVSTMGFEGAFLANMADECFVPYQLTLNRADFKAFQDATNAKAKPDPNFHLTWAPSRIDVSADGTMGYTWGGYDYTGSGKDGKPATDKGLYLTIWKRVAGGGWKVVFDGSPELYGDAVALKKFLAKPELAPPGK
jgi:ketosteroid isomerase-like protein